MTPRATRRWRTVTILAVVALITVGCSSPEEPQISESTAQFLEEDAKQTAAALGLEDPPDYEVIRIIERDEWQSVHLQCMTDAGFDVSSTEDGEGISYPEFEDPALAWSLVEAIYLCDVQYPLDPKYYEPLSHAELERLYEYRTRDLVECLEGHGYHTEAEPPSRTVFVQEDGWWSPYQELMYVMGREAFVDMKKACPEVPEDLGG